MGAVATVTAINKIYTQISNWILNSLRGKYRFSPDHFYFRALEIHAKTAIFIKDERVKVFEALHRYFAICPFSIQKMIKINSHHRILIPQNRIYNLHMS